MKETCRDRGLLLAVVAGGPYEWLRTARQAFDGYAVNDEVLWGMFRYFQHFAGEDPSKKLDRWFETEGLTERKPS